MPGQREPRISPCLTCTHFHGQFYGRHLLCERDAGRYVVGVPAMGCARAR
jgi:hypothetical protein